MFSSGSGMGDAAPSENIPDNGRSNPVLPGQDNQGYTSFPIHKTASASVQGPPLLAGHLMNLINNTNTAGVGSSQLPPGQPNYEPNPLGGVGGFWPESEGDDDDQISEFELGGITAPNLQSGALQGSDPGGMQSRFPARLGVSNLQGAAVEVPALGDLSVSLDELLGNTEVPRKRKRQVRRRRSPDRDDSPGIAQPQLPKLQGLTVHQRYWARKKEKEQEKDRELVELREESVRTRALYDAASSDLEKAQKNIAHLQKNKQYTANKLLAYLFELVTSSVEPQNDKEEWRREIFSQNGNQAFDSLWEMYMSLKNQHMSTLALLIEAVNMKGGDDIRDAAN